MALIMDSFQGTFFMDNDENIEKKTHRSSGREREDQSNDHDEVSEDTNHMSNYVESDSHEDELMDGEDHVHEDRHEPLIDSIDKRVGKLVKTGDKGYRKTYDEVFNDSTLKTIYRLFQRKMLDTLEHPISTGKEANVFLGIGNEKQQVAVKIFRESTTTFRKVRPYIEGDPRFQQILRGRRGLVEIWARKEFKNLKRMANAEIRVPEAIAIDRNVLIMEYIGDETRPAPTLRQWYIDHRDDPDLVAKMERFYECITGMMKIMHQDAKMVHADLSEFNILIHDDEPVIIDVGQSVLLAHPMTREFLERDVRNITAFFRKVGVQAEEAELWDYLMRKDD